MTEVATLSPELSRGVSALARALVTAARSAGRRRTASCLCRFPRGALGTDETAVVTHEHPTDPFRPQVKILLDRLGVPHEAPMLVNTWEPDGRGEFRHAVVEAVDPDAVQIDPLSHL